MSPRLPFSSGDRDEFCHPTDGWLLLDRAVTYDNWITWRHALPAAHSARQRLSQPVAQAIAALAHELHLIHQRLANYTELSTTPFLIPRWWDPYAEDQWNTGGICLFRIEDVATQEIIHSWDSHRGQVELRGVSDRHLEATLITAPAKGRSARSRPEGSPAAASPRRKRQSPPPGTPAASARLPPLAPSTPLPP